jgi:protein kinase-like protein
MKEFGPFVLEERLGEGATAEVYRARPREGGPEVALKILRLEQSLDPRKLARFEREGAVAARLDHPGIVRVHSAGEVGGVPYLAYQLVRPAQTLTEAFKVQELEARVERVREVALAMAYAHGEGVLHRDLKPDNVLVAQGRSMVADFGLARHADDERLTLTGGMVGTPIYMAPELLNGERGSEGSEIWALGVMLYEALCGAPPFAAESYVALVDAQAEPLSFPPHVTRAQRELCQRALELDPARRYPSCQALADDLIRVESGQAPQAGGGRSSSPRVALGAALLLAVVGVAWAIGTRGGAPPAATPASSLTPPVKVSPTPTRSRVERRAPLLEKALAETSEGAPVSLVRLRSLVPRGGEAPLSGDRAELLARRTLEVIRSSVESPSWSDKELLRLEALAAARLRPGTSRLGDQLLDGLLFEAKLTRLSREGYFRALRALIQLDVVPLAEHLLALSAEDLRADHVDATQALIRMQSELHKEGNSSSLYLEQAPALLELRREFGPRVRAHLVALARGGRVNPVAELEAALVLNPAEPWAALALAEVLPAAKARPVLERALVLFREAYSKRVAELGMQYFRFYARCARRFVALGDRAAALRILEEVPGEFWNKEALKKLRAELEAK